MATLTPNYGFTKPAYDEAADVGVINDNMDAIDTALDATDDNVADNASDIATLQSALGQVEFLNKTISTGSSRTYTFTDTCYYVILCLGNVTAGQGIIYGFINSAGTVHNVSKTAASSITPTVQSDNKRKLVVANGSSSGMAICFIKLSGTMPTT